MAKAKVKTGAIVMLVAALLGVVAILMMLAPGITVGHKLTDKTESISGFALMFGSEEGHNFNFMMFLSLIFAIVGLAGVLLSFMLKGKIGGFMAIAGFLLAGIFFFLFRAVYPMSMENGADVIKAAEAFGTTFSLGIGAIMAGIFSILAALASAAATFAFKK